MPLGGLFRKLLFSIRFRSIKTLLSDDLTAESRVLFHRRDHRARASASRRSCTYDPDPYLAIADGRLFWVQDAYTTSDRYPYSTPPRRAASTTSATPSKVDDRRLPRAHDASTWSTRRTRWPPRCERIFPGSAPAARRDAGGPAHAPALPAGRSSRCRRPMFSTYHMTNPAVFYNKEDQWEVPAIDVGGRSRAHGAVLHDHEAAGRGAAGVHPDAAVHARGRRTTWRPGWWRAATASTTASWSSSSSPSRRWSSVRGRWWRASTRTRSISPQITLWNQQGSEVIQGTLLVIPIEESLLYIRPLYLRAAGGRIPELKRVIVAYQNQIVMEETLDAAHRADLPSGRARCRAGAAAGRTAIRPAGAAPATASARRRRATSGWRQRPRALPAGARRPSARATGRATARRSSGSGEVLERIKRR